MAQNSADGWTIHAAGFDPLCERGVEAALSIENGNFGVRAALEEGSAASHPLIIVAGIYIDIAGPAGQTLLTLPDPATLHLAIEHAEIDIQRVQTIEHLRTLDMRAGELRRAWTFDDGTGRRWRLESTRAASAAEAHLYLHRVVLALERGDTANLDIRFVAASDDKAGTAGEVGGDVRMAVVGPASARTRVSRSFAGPWKLASQSAAASVGDGQHVAIESVTSVASGAAPDAGSFDREHQRNRDAWRARWDDAAITVGGHEDLNRAARFATYHLLAAGSECDGRWSIGARNLSGEGYHGHVFWDTETFMLPALMLTRPAAARSALLYRHRTLPAACERARGLGYEGALFAWESTDTGEDRTPHMDTRPDGTTIRILTGEQEHHIAGDVPYAVMQYWRATGDDAFMREAGAEIVFECARFWNSRVTPGTQEHDILKVIGPDEFHENVNNDAYTNTIARWTLETAIALSREDGVAGDAMHALDITLREADEWEATASTIKRSRFTGDEVVSQFDGFLDLDDAPVRKYRDARVPIDLALGFAAMQHLRAVKQADVLMSAALLPDIWSEGGLRANYAFYEPRTAHTSSLSPPMHALVAAWLREPDDTIRYLEQSAAIDLGDNFVGASLGVHIGSMGGLWQAVVFGLGGLKFDADGIAFDPYLPPPISELALSFVWRGRHVDARIADDVRIRIDGEAATVRVNREQRRVSGDATFAYDPMVTYWSATVGAPA
ncbi:MAG TPA: glycosyl hydrolase family 65 protein [Dehalococcoidia bacterium]|nr:glycosyl hydrolase family 65 protein [Dehalococcoidia bacterium]